MKKFLFIIAICFCFFGCSTKSEFKTSYDKAEYGFANFIYLGEVRGDLVGNVYVDTNTNVLYIANSNGKMSPIMKSDGSCLTFVEWREKNGFEKNAFLEDVPFPGKKETKSKEKEMGMRECLELALDPDRTPHHWINPNDPTDHYCERCGLHIYKEEGGGTTINRTDFNRDVRYCHK